MNRWTKYNEKKYNQYEKGKIQCVLCPGWYHKICSHIVQKHNITNVEYKELIGKDKIKGVLSEKSKKLAQKRNKENPHVIKENLLIKGVKTRFVKGQKGLGKYKRSIETMKRLKQKSFIKNLKEITIY